VSALSNLSIKNTDLNLLFCLFCCMCYLFSAGEFCYLQAAAVIGSCSSYSAG